MLATQNGKLVQEDDVECRPERVPNSVLDENVDVFLIRKYFSTDAWLMVESILERKMFGCVMHVIAIFTLNHQLYVNLV